MIVRQLQEEEKGSKRVVTDTWESTRLLLRDDGVGFSFHITTIYPNTETSMWYKYHFEAVFCIEGEGEVQELPDGPVHRISPGTIYVLDKHEKHVLRAKTKLVLACVFNPPCVGDETHDADGAYRLSDGQIPPKLEGLRAA